MKMFCCVIPTQTKFFSFQVSTICSFFFLFFSFLLFLTSGSSLKIVGVILSFECVKYNSILLAECDIVTVSRDSDRAILKYFHIKKHVCKQ